MKSGLYTVDKIEADVIRLELRDNQEVIVIQKNDIKENVVSEIKQGDILEIEANFFGKVKDCKILYEMTEKIKEENAKKLDGLFDN